MKNLATEIINGRRLTKDDDLSFFETVNLDELTLGADMIRSALCNNHVDLCTIINGRAGKCSENCKFCSQSSFHNTNCEKYDLLDCDTILKDCEEHVKEGVHAYSIVTAGRTVQGKDLDNLVTTYQKLHKEFPDIRLCASHGLLTYEAFCRLKQSGVTMYHENLETSKNYFPSICTTHTYEDKINEITMAQKAGLDVCSGGIIGMGETFKDRIDMALALSELKIKSIPINALIPVKGTVFENLTPLTTDDILRTVAMFRYINPTAYIRMAAGRNYFKDGGKDLFKSGVNATITGNMLTTVGNNTSEDKQMLENMGFDIALKKERIKL